MERFGRVERLGGVRQGLEAEFPGVEGEDRLRPAPERLGKPQEARPEANRVLPPGGTHPDPGAPKRSRGGATGRGQGSAEGVDPAGQERRGKMGDPARRVDDPKSGIAAPLAVDAEAARRAGRSVPFSAHGVVSTPWASIQEVMQGQCLGVPGQMRRMRAMRRSFHTRQMASRTMAFDILDSPSARSVKTMGISSIRNPLRQARNLSSIWKL